MEQSFWSKVNRSGGAHACWPYMGKRCTKGYGQWSLERKRGAKRTGAHRMAYALTYGEIPAGLQVLHRCDNPPCCNPAHLFIGTHADNMADKARKGRCAAASKGNLIDSTKLTSEQVLAIRAKHASGQGSCATIAREYGVSKATIGQIISRATWKHVA
jgi:hypothetical protein